MGLKGCQSMEPVRAPGSGALSLGTCGLQLVSAVASLK